MKQNEITIKHLTNIKNKLWDATFDSFGITLKHFFDHITNNANLSSLMNQVRREYPYTKDEIEARREEIRAGRFFSFSSIAEQASYCYEAVMDYTVFGEEISYNIHHRDFGGSFQERKDLIINDFVGPIEMFLTHQIEIGNSKLYLLERYKKRTEWFKGQELVKKYREVKTGFEKILEDDLRLFLFDQGVDYPFSTPTISRGASDIVAEVDSDNSLIVEIKVIDKERTYGKNRIFDGFKQILTYSNQFHKQTGYLVIFNFDPAHIVYDFVSNEVFPVLSLNGKSFYFITINLNSALPSKSGKASVLEVKEREIKSVLTSSAI